MKKTLIYLLVITMCLGVLTGCGSSNKADEDLRIGALTGPTAMGMAKLLDDIDGGNAGFKAEYSVYGSADEITPLVLQGQMDIASVPVNLASVIYNKTGGAVKLIAVDVMGVLSIGEFNSDEITSVADLKGKTVYASGKGSTPEYFLRYILSENGIDPDSDVNIEWKSEPSEIVALLNAKQTGIAMLPQPYATAAKMQLGDGFNLKLSVADEWEKIDGAGSCVTAGVIVRSEFLENNREAVEKFLSEFRASVQWVNENPAAAAQICERLSIAKSAVAEKAIPSCSIVCLEGEKMKSDVRKCLEVIYSCNSASIGGKIPEDDFYYEG